MNPLTEMERSEVSHETLSDFKNGLEKLVELALERQKNLDKVPTMAEPCPLDANVKLLPREIPEQGWGLSKSFHFLIKEIAGQLNPGHVGPRYFGFVTGGVLPSALLSDWFTTLFDQNVQVHLPKETSSTVIEHYTIEMIIKLLGLDSTLFSGTLTTGATSANLLALLCAREKTMQNCMKKRHGISNWSAAENGLCNSHLTIKIFVSSAHASIKKTAALAGIGRANVIDVGKQQRGKEQVDQSAAPLVKECLDFDLVRLEEEMKQCYNDKQPAIVVIGMGEVVTGALSDQTLQIRKLCDKYDAWLHMDAAFSAFVCLIDGYQWISTHMNVCDSITSDGHKALNVPYDCGISLIRKDVQEKNSPLCILDDVCGPGMGGGPSYLASSSSKDDKNDQQQDTTLQYIANLPSPLNRNLENSRRFRALPLYVSLLSQGKNGTRNMIQRNLEFASRLRTWFKTCPFYELLLPICPPLDENQLDLPQSWKGFWTTTVIFFRAHSVHCPVESFKESQSGHIALVQAIKETKKIYVSPGTLQGIGGVRIAVSNWSTGLNGEKDFEITTAALLQVMQS